MSVDVGSRGREAVVGSVGIGVGLIGVGLEDVELWKDVGKG